LGIAVPGVVAQTTQSHTIHRIGVLNAPIPEFADTLRDALRDLGYTEGKSILIEWRQATGTDQELRSMASQLEASGVELIVATATPEAKAALQATSLPVVFSSGDPVAAGLAASLAKPGGNGTGVSSTTTDLTPKRLELLLRVSPKKARRILYLENSSNPLRANLLEEARVAARTFDVEIKSLDAKGVRGLDSALRGIRHNEADAILVAGDLLFLSNRAKVARAVREAKLPAMFPWREYHAAGVLMSYSPSRSWATRQLAVYVDKILKGAKPAELPIEQVSKYELVINLRLAQSLRLEIPQEVLLQADQVIQ
jgi:putative ABC transport system substrate-binding protein